jgi:hypothetical protein
VGPPPRGLRSEYELGHGPEAIPGRRGRAQPIGACEWLRGWLPRRAHTAPPRFLVPSFQPGAAQRRAGSRSGALHSTTTHTRVDKYAPHAAHQRVLPGPPSTSTVTPASPTSPAQPTPALQRATPTMLHGAAPRLLDPRRAVHSRRPPAHARDARQRPWLTVGAGRGAFQVPRMTPCVGGYWKRFGDGRGTLSLFFWSWWGRGREGGGEGEGSFGGSSELPIVHRGRGLP